LRGRTVKVSTQALRTQLSTGEATVRILFSIRKYYRKQNLKLRNFIQTVNDDDVDDDYDYDDNNNNNNNSGDRNAIKKRSREYSKI